MTHPRVPALGVLLAISACASRAPESSPTPAGHHSSVADLPIPAATGPLALHVQYPGPDAVITARDSTFLLGSLGAGDATLSINDYPVRVLPNGAWLAWVPLPPPDSASASTAGTLTFHLIAHSPHDSASEHLVVRWAPPSRRAPTVDGPWIDPTSFVPSGVAWLPADEDLRLQVRAAPGAHATLLLADGTEVPMTEEDAGDEVPGAVRAFDRDFRTMPHTIPASSRYVGVIRGHALGPSPGPMLNPTDTVPGSTGWARVRLSWPSQSLESVWPLRLALTDTTPLVVRLDDDPEGAGSDSITVGRAAPGATYHWFFPTGTRSIADRRQNGDVRLRLAPGSVAWVSAGDVHALPAGTWPPLGRIGSLTSTSAADRVIIRIPVGARIPFRVSDDDRAVTLEFYSSVSDIDWTRYAPGDSIVRRIDWSQDAGVVHVVVRTNRPLYGYRTRWDGTDLLLEVRRPPAVQASAPFRGRIIAIDPGHPPAGATGPTGYREAQANLAVSLQLQRMLEAAGATVVMTRTADADLGLNQRIVMAEQAGAEVLVSIHNNALPDGVNPFTNNGTSVFYNHATSLPLARSVQRALVRQLGLPDLGVGRGDLALVRPTWQPSILTEGLFMIVPEQEAALRSAQGQLRYAQGVYDGLQEFLLALARPPM